MSDPQPVELDLNQEVTTGDAWGNLGLWQAGDTYPAAAERLAQHIGEAAGLRAGSRILDLGLGTGRQWAVWQQHFGVTAITGAEPQATHCALARRWCRPEDRIYQASAAEVAGQLGPDSFDAVVSVDAAYHFDARAGLLESLASCLRADGRLAWSDLVLLGAPARPGRLLSAACAAASIPAANLMTDEHYADVLAARGWRDVSIERRDEEVLDAFASWWSGYRREYRVNRKMWLRAEATARILQLNRRQRRLGYAVISATAPEKPPLR